MPVPNLEACVSFVAANRLIADRFTAKAETLLELVQSMENVEERMRIADLMCFSENRAIMHTSMADRQERDLGITCHCPKTERSLDAVLK